VGGYGVREVSSILGLSVAQVRSYVRAGFLRPARGPRGALRFSFQDLLLLRTAQGLVAARIPERRVKRALRKLKDQLPEGRPLTGVQVVVEGDRIIVHDGSARWQPESGQVLFDFEVGEIAERVAPLVTRAAGAESSSARRLSADDWYDWACDLEDAAPDQAREAYRRALEIEPDHGAALVNLGRLLHAAGAPGVAEAHYRRALEIQPADATAAFNLGVVLEDQGRLDEAVEAYERAARIDPRSADAHYNAALLHERRGDEAAALRHLKIYRRLTRAGS
jgi:tetratricopeptide (TPR) repeat protein